MPAAPERIHAGTTIGPYTIVRLAGEGGMGQVYEATQRSLKRQVAIKVMAEWASARTDLRARFLREGEVAARIRHHNIVEVYDVGVWDEGGGRPYLVMEFLEGMSLDERMRRVGIFNEAEAAEIMLPVLSAVAAAHDRGVIHRDIKPENIFLAEQDSGLVPKVLDFGISRVVTARVRLTMNAAQLGTPHYMSPEQARGETVDPRSDQYSLGVILYEMVTGQLPRDHDSPLKLLQMVSSGSFPPPTKHVPTLSKSVEGVVLRAMEGEPDERYTDLKDMALELAAGASPTTKAYWERELRGSVGGLPASAESAQPAVSTNPTLDQVEEKPGWIKWAAAAALLAAVGIGAALTTSGEEQNTAADTTVYADSPAPTEPSEVASAPVEDTVPEEPEPVEEPTTMDTEATPEVASEAEMEEAPQQPQDTRRARARNRWRPRARTAEPAPAAPAPAAAEPAPAEPEAEPAPAPEPPVMTAMQSPSRMETRREWQPRVRATDNINPF